MARGKGKRKRKRIVSSLSIGQSCRLNQRHALHFASLTSHITSEKEEVNLTDDPNVVLNNDDTTHGIYMEWSEKRESIFIHINSRSRKRRIKFELLAVFGAELLNSKELKPSLAFSHKFDSDPNWWETKLLLEEVFGPHSTPLKDRPNCIYAFTRVKEQVYFRMFKINHWPDEVDHGLKLGTDGACFVLKPDIDDAVIDEEIFYTCHKKRNYDLMVSTVMHDPSLVSPISHLVDGLGTTLLPAPPDTTEWEGFNTTVEEYFQRYRAFKKMVVPGTGPNPKAWDSKGKWEKKPRGMPKNPPAVIESIQLCLPFKLFGRSLITCCEDIFAKPRPACYENIELKNLYFRGNKLKILFVKRVPYTNAQAAKNLNQVVVVIRELLKLLGLPAKDFPVDLKEVLGQLEGSEPPADLNRSKNHSCWMDGPYRMMMMDDTVCEFHQEMTPNEQLDFGLLFPEFTPFQAKLNRNWLMKDCSDHDLPTTQNGRRLARSVMKQKLEGLFYTQELAERRESAEKLFTINRVLSTPRNAFHHLHQSAAKFNLVMKTREEVEFVVASDFSDIYFKIQDGVIRVFGNKALTRDEWKSTYARFARYFQPPETSQIRDEDKLKPASDGESSVRT